MYGEGKFCVVCHVFKLILGWALFYTKGLKFFIMPIFLIRRSFLGLVNGFTAYGKGFGNVVGESLAVFPIKVADGDADGSLFG